MSYNEILQQLGLTQNRVEAIIILGFILTIVGVLVFSFWKYIVIGLVAMGVLTVFANHAPTVKPQDNLKPEQVLEQKVEKPDPEKVLYLEDCESLTNKPEMCEELWSERKADTEVKPTKKPLPEGFKSAENTKLLDTDNQEYKARRAEALKKPDAVIFQGTYR